MWWTGSLARTLPQCEAFVNSSLLQLQMERRRRDIDAKGGTASFPVRLLVCLEGPIAEVVRCAVLCACYKRTCRCVLLLWSALRMPPCLYPTHFLLPLSQLHTAIFLVFLLPD